MQFLHGFMLSLLAFLYQRILKKIFFLINPEIVHERMVHVGELMGKSVVAKRVLALIFVQHNPFLAQKIHGIHFKNPIGLSAGFDYDCRLTQILPSIGFGFETVGTVTYHPYEGNYPPRLGRLPRSRSLMVNKGFKSRGVQHVAAKLKKLHFEIPVGISIGRTNTLAHTSTRQAVDDICDAFAVIEQAKIRNAYYELNISCPNLKGNISFYVPSNLQMLLARLQKLHLSKPVFIKMPIEKSDDEVRRMMDVIVKFDYVKGVIIGNLQKNRNDPALVASEVKKFKTGNFSGKPCFNRSNELISLVYQEYGDKLTIIGSGGVFSAQDAYEKIKRGATLVQLITGMIFQGPQLIAQINRELAILLEKDGYLNISQAVGSAYSKKGPSPEEYPGRAYVPTVAV